MQEAREIRVTVEAGFLTGSLVIHYDRGKVGHNVVAYYPGGYSLRYGANTLVEAITHAIGELMR